MYDIIIIGAGPAGLTAALYARRANKNVLLIEKETFGGQITFSPKVENIPGFEALSGNEFAEKLVEQVLNQGAEVESAEVFEIQNGKIKTVVTDDGERQAKAVIVATGAKHRVLGLDGEEKFIGNGISFCAVCDGAFYAGKNVVVVGGGNSALQEALMLADLAKNVYLVQNLDFLTGEKKLAEQVLAKDNVHLMLGTVLDGYLGDKDLTGVRVKKVSDGQTEQIRADGVFLAVGLMPQNEPFSNVLPLNEQGYVISDENCLCGTDGIFVAGDCRQKKIRQVTTAAADGAVAALAACSYLEEW